MTNRYIGNRYVPKILSDETPWVNTTEYEALTVVMYQGNSYTSRKTVPTGIDIMNKIIGHVQGITMHKLTNIGKKPKMQLQL